MRWSPGRNARSRDGHRVRRRARLLGVGLLALAAAASQLRLLVVEQACASGEDATDRVLVEVDADDDEIRLLVGVAPRDGDQSCPSNPATPFTVDLNEPVGNRQVIDVGRYPPREVTEASP